MNEGSSSQLSAVAAVAPTNGANDEAGLNNGALNGYAKHETHTHAWSTTLTDASGSTGNDSDDGELKLSTAASHDRDAPSLARSQAAAEVVVTNGNTTSSSRKGRKRHNFKGKHHYPHRVIVIGGGMAGLACARELQHRGYWVLVVEARNRVGGRCMGGEILLQRPSSQQQQTDTGRQQSPTTATNIDLGGALIHGMDDGNPLASLVQQLGVGTRPLQDCLLLDDSGWPVDARLDDRVSQTFNDCLDECFRRVAAAANEGATGIGKTRSSTKSGVGASSASSSFGDIFDQVCAERGVTQSSPLLRWHQANLEVSCGASLGRLGWQWNEDEPYGYEGSHNAISTSWKTVVETLAHDLDVVYDAPVQRVHVVHPRKEKSLINETHQSSSDATSSGAVNGWLSKKRRRSISPPGTAATSFRTRRSRRLLGEQAATSNNGKTPQRRSLRVGKGQGVERFTASAASSSPHRLHSPSQTERHDPATPRHTVVQVTLQSGAVLEAESVICTLPLAILQADAVLFDPPLPLAKQEAIQRMGCGLLNKCVLSFESVFWPDSDFLGLATEEWSYLVLNANVYTQRPCLIFMFGGDFAKEVENWTDKVIVEDCLRVLKKICGKNTLPDPVDYRVTRWGHDEFARMAFTFVPPGVDGMKELHVLNEPVMDSTGQLPALQFAGEHTTPFHPSTMHGAFLSGIREAYRLDIAVDPDAGGIAAFESDSIYEPTFVVDRLDGAATNVRARPAARANKAGVGKKNRGQHRHRGASIVMTLRKRPASDATGCIVPPTLQNRPTEQQSTVSPCRRSQRSTGQGHLFGGALDAENAQSNGVKDCRNAETDLQALTDRTLLRSLNSYGRDKFDYVREMALPVYGHDVVRTPKQTSDLCRSLLFAQKRNVIVKSASTWKWWLAKTIFPPTALMPMQASTPTLLVTSPKASSQHKKTKKPSKRRPMGDAVTSCTASASEGRPPPRDRNAARAERRSKRTSKTTKFY